MSKGKTISQRMLEWLNKRPECEGLILDTATPYSFHSGHWQKANGAFSWCLRNNGAYDIGSCHTMTEILKAKKVFIDEGKYQSNYAREIIIED